MSVSVGDLLLKLIPALQVEVFTRWLELQDVIKLDSACCSSKHQETFSALLREEYCVFDHPSRSLDNKHLKWLMRRKAKISRLVLLPQFVSTHRTQLFQTTGKHLRILTISSVNADAESNIIYEICTMCTNVEALVFTDGGFISQNDVCSILQRLPLLRHLDLSRCTKLNDEIFEHICSHAQNLRVLDLSYCHFVEGALQKEVLFENHTIHTLNMTGCKGIEVCLPFVLQCKDLKTLYMNNLKLFDAFAILTHCPALTTLSVGVELGQSQIISETELNTLISLISNLEVLHLYHRRKYQWEERQLERLIRSAPKLHTLFAARLDDGVAVCKLLEQSIAEVHRFGGNGKRVNDTQHQLHTLFIDDMVSSELQNILQLCPYLVSLSILTLGELNDVEDSIHTLMTIIGSSNIRILDILDCSLLKSSAVLQLQNLVSVSFHECVSLEHHELVEFLSYHLTLRKLSLIDCQNLHHKSLLTIIEKCTTLEELTFDNTCDSFMDTMLVEGLIKLLRPCLKLSLQLHPE